jgi:hypothetical protein
MRFNYSTPHAQGCEYDSQVRAILLIVAWPVLAANYQLKPTPETVVWGYYDAKARPALRIHSGDTVKARTLTVAQAT